MSTKSKGKGRRSSHSSSNRQRPELEHRPSSDQNYNDSGGWSPWIWQNDAQRSVRSRQGSGELEYEFDPPFKDTQATQPREIPGGQAPTLESIDEGSPSGTLYPSPNYTFSPGVEGITSQMGNTHLNGPKYPDGKLITTRDARYNSEQYFGQEYKKHHSNEFKVGKVIKMIWLEPMGITSGSRKSDQTVVTQVEQGKDRHGQQKFEKARRFVIVAAFKGHCICLAVSTYTGQGTLKSGVHAGDHAMIYTAKRDGTAPTISREEFDKGLTRSPIRMEPVNPREKLDEASRLNFAKLYTVEHNVKVRFIGKIHDAHLKSLVGEYHSVHHGGTAPEANWDQRETRAPAAGSWADSGVSSTGEQQGQSGSYSYAQGQQQQQRQQHDSNYSSGQYPAPNNFGPSINTSEFYAAPSRLAQPSPSTNYYNHPAYPSTPAGNYNLGYPTQGHNPGYSQAQAPEQLYTRSFRLEEPAPSSYSENHIQYQQYGSQGHPQPQGPTYPPTGGYSQHPPFSDPDELYRGS